MRHRSGSGNRAATRAAGLTLALALAASGVAFSGSSPSETEIRSGSLVAVVRHRPFGITFRQDAGAELRDASGGILDPSGRYGTLAFTTDARAQAQTPTIGYGVFADAPTRWLHATRVVAVDGQSFVVATQDPLRTFTVGVQSSGEGIVSVTATLSNPAGVTATGWSFERPAGERFLGFGERSDGADQTGRVVESWNEEGPWSGGAVKPATDPSLGDRWQGPPPFDGTNFSMPWLVSNRGYGFLLDTSWPSRFRLASDRPDAWNAETRDPSFSFRVFAGPTPAGVIARFSAAVGRQPEPAKWFFGPWYQPREISEQTLARRWREEWDVPATVAQTYYHWLPCGAEPVASQKANTDMYHSLGYMVTTYVNSFVCQNNPRGKYEEGDSNGYFVRNAAGETYLVPMVDWIEDSPWEAIVDFTNPDAAAWWQDIVRSALQAGFDGWMEDFGEYVPPDAVMADGRSGLAAHNDYCTLYHRTSDELTRSARGLDFAQFIRCGYTGTAQHARIVWGGDPTEDFSKADGLAAAVSQGISMGLSGVAYWGSDTGGFHALFTEGRTGEELLTRWLEFGAFSGIMRTESNGWGRPEDPERRAQVWDDGVRPAWRKYSKLRTQLFPYIWDAAEEYRSTGMPIMRHLALAYPDDPGSYFSEAEYEYLFGPDILVAPVVDQGATARDVYLPPGEWVNFWDAVSYDPGDGSFDATGSAPAIAGGVTIPVSAPLDTIPLFVRAGTCLTLLPPDVDTLAEVGSHDGAIVHLSDAAGRERTIAFGEDACP